MARRGRDLFEILGSRSGSRRTSGDALSAPVELGRGAMDFVRGIFGGAHGGSRRRSSGGRSRRKSSSGANMGVYGLAVAILLSVGAGFLVGRWTSGSASVPEETLSQRAAGGGAEARTPGSLPRPRSSLTPAQEEEVLGSHYYACGAYAFDRRPAAARLAHWLRTQGFDRARIRMMRRRGKDSKMWAVLCYASGPDDTRPRDFLLSLDPPAFEPLFEVWRNQLPEQPRS